MTTPHQSLPPAARKMLSHLQAHYQNMRTPLPLAQIAAGAFVSESHAREMLPMLREAGLIVYIGTAEQAGRDDLQKNISMFAPAGVAMLPRLVQPLAQREKAKPGDGALGPRWGGTYGDAKPRKQKYKGEKMPPRYVPPFEEMTPKNYDLFAARNLAMLVR